MIDLRSDTVTKPSPAMLAAMVNADVGDDVYGEDPTINALEIYAAKLTGKAAALFVTSGTQGNLLGILSHCQRGHEYIAGQTAHTYQFEAGGAAVLGGIQPYTIPFNSKGEIPLDRLQQAIKPNDFHFAITRLLCLENTQAGKVLSPDYLKAFSDLAQHHGLKRHLDGSRVFNAAIKLAIPVSTICQYFDTVSICLSKGLGCPVGSLLMGDAETIQSARRWRKMLGGGMRQAGILAAAGLYALKHNITLLSQDHENTKKVATEIKQMQQLKLAEPVQTNMLMLANNPYMDELKTYLAQAGIKISGTRWVFHQDISEADLDRLISACWAFERLRHA